MIDILVRINADLEGIIDTIIPIASERAKAMEGIFDIYVLHKGKPVLIWRTETSREADEWVKAWPGLRFYIDNRITKEMALSFYKDCVGTINHGIEAKWSLTEEVIAEKMHIGIDKASDYLWACAKYKITERQGGGWVI